MKLCVNYLMELRELFEEYDLSYLDYIKLYSINGDLTPFDWCLSKKNVMFHGLLGEGGSSIADIGLFEIGDVEKQKEYYSRGKTPYVSLHITRSTDNGQNEQQALEEISKNVKRLKDIFNMKIILENVPASIEHKENMFFSSPEFICKAVRDNDCGFLFDIGHARVAAKNLNIPFNEYVSRLPMERLIETHLSGVMLLKNGRITANHSKMNEEDYEFIEEAIKKYKTLEVITLEYGSFMKRDTVLDYPIVDDTHINKEAKKEIIYQLERLHKIIEENKN